MIRRHLVAILLAPAIALATASLAPGLEKPGYEVLEREDDVELRLYEPYLVAETTVAGEFDEAMSRAFRRLFRYISGDDRKRLDPDAPKIAMTAPVTMAKVGGKWRMTFMVPSKYTLETAPSPADDGVRLRAEPGGLVAALTYSGTRDRRRYLERQEQLQAWIAERGLAPAGAPMYAGYDAPWVPWFLRRNEVLIPVATAGGPRQRTGAPAAR